MGGTAWVLKGTGIGYCNCDYGCPCQFMGRPSSSDGSCKAVQFIQIDDGRYGAINLDGLKFGWLISWPGAVHEGNGVIQLLIGESADEEQREAIRRIAYNEDTDELLTPFAIYHSTCTTAHEPIFAPIELDFDAEARTAHNEVPGIVDADAEPVRNPVTGEPHRAQIVLPEGFEATVLETASGTVRATSTVPLDFADSFACFYKLHMTDRGIVRD